MRALGDIPDRSLWRSRDLDRPPRLNGHYRSTGFHLASAKSQFVRNDVRLVTPNNLSRSPCTEFGPIEGVARRLYGPLLGHTKGYDTPNNFKRNSISSSKVSISRISEGSSINPRAASRTRRPGSTNLSSYRPTRPPALCDLISRLYRLSPEKARLQCDSAGNSGTSLLQAARLESWRWPPTGRETQSGCTWTESSYSTRKSRCLMESHLSSSLPKGRRIGQRTFRFSLVSRELDGSCLFPPGVRCPTS